MKKLFIILLISIGFCHYSFSQSNNSETLENYSHTDSLKNCTILLDDYYKMKSDVFNAGDNLVICSYLNYASVATGVAAVIVAGSNLSRKGDEKKIDPLAYLLGGFSAGFALASITIKMRAGKSLKISGSPLSSSVTYSF